MSGNGSSAVQEILLAPPDPDWRGFTSLRRVATNFSWEPAEESSNGPVEDGVAVGPELPSIVTMYQSGDQVEWNPPVIGPISETVIQPTVFSMGATATYEDNVPFPPEWDGVTTGNGRIAVAEHRHADDGTALYGNYSSHLANLKVSFTTPVFPQGVAITGVKLRASISHYGRFNFRTNEGSTHVSPTGEWNNTQQGIFNCGGASPPWSDTYIIHGFDPFLEPNALETWSAEWAADHFNATPLDHKLGTAGDAIPPTTIVRDDIYSQYGDGGNHVLVPLQGWQAQVQPGLPASVIISVDDEPTVLDLWRYEPDAITPAEGAMMDACLIETGNPPLGYPTHDRNWAFNGTLGGLSIAGIQIVIEHDAYVPQPGDPGYPDPGPPPMPDLEERAIAYFDLAGLPEVEPLSATFLFYTVTAFTADPGSEFYVIPIDPDNPSHEGPMPISIAQHHPAGLVDKSGRAIYSTSIQNMSQAFPVLIEVDVPTSLIPGREQIGFQLAIKPASADPFLTSIIRVLTDQGIGDPDSSYHGPRLLLRYPGEGEVDVEITADLRVNRALSGTTLFQMGATGRLDLEPDRRILDHAARERRGY